MAVAYEAPVTNPNKLWTPQTPERFAVPTLDIVYKIPSEDVGIPSELAPREVLKFRVNDMYLEAIGLEQLEIIRAREGRASFNAMVRRTQKAWSRAAGTAYTDENGNTHLKDKRQWGDPVTKAAFFGSESEGLGDQALAAWQTLVPRATALRYLTDPFNVSHIVGADGQAVEATDTTRLWLAGCTDAEAIRSRGAGLAMQVQEFVGLYRNRYGQDAPITMMSIACGTALPTLQAAMSANATGAKLFLMDIDRSAMAETTHLAQEIGFPPENITSEAMNIFSPQAMAKLKERLTANGEDNRPLIVDAMGIFEYTGEELRPPGKESSDSMLYDPVAFLKSAYDLVRSGGRLIFGQMRDDRPNADFTMGVIAWPYVCMRSPKKVMELIIKAGIDPANVKLSLTPEGVYTLVSIDKPAPRGGLVSIPTQVRRQSGFVPDPRFLGALGGLGSGRYPNAA